MDNGPLVNEEIAAGAELVRRFNEVRPVKVAFWLRLDDEQFRYLCIASDEVGSILEGYQDLAKAEAGWTSSDLDPMRIRVIQGDSAQAKAAFDQATRYPQFVGTRTGSQPFADVYAGDLYIYPLSILDPAPAN